jgi:hypothetical protein
MVPSGRWETRSGCSLTQGWSGSTGRRCRGRCPCRGRGRFDEGVEVGEGAELAGMDGGVAAFGGADGPGAADVVGLGGGGVVFAFAEGVADGVDGRHVEDVEAHGGDLGEAGSTSRRVPCGWGRARWSGGRARTRRRSGRARGRPREVDRRRSERRGRDPDTVRPRRRSLRRMGIDGRACWRRRETQDLPRLAVGFRHRLAWLVWRPCARAQRPFAARGVYLEFGFGLRLRRLRLRGPAPKIARRFACPDRRTKSRSDRWRPRWCKTTRRCDRRERKLTRDRWLRDGEGRTATHPGPIGREDGPTGDHVRQQRLRR